MSRPEPPSKLQKVRNFGIAAHIDAGKTTLTERILYYTGATYKIGEVHEGNTEMDYLPEERARGITITAAVTHCAWAGHNLHLIDTPGHVDFTIEVERSMRVLDGVILVLDGVKGVEPQTETVWRQAERYRVPRIIFVNKMDRPGADFERAVNSVASRLHGRPVPVAVPSELSGKVGVIDLLTREWVTFEGERGADINRQPLPEALEDQYAHWYEKLVEAAADFDDSVAEAYLSGDPVDSETIVAILRKQTIANKLQPVFGGAALRDYGVQLALTGVITYLPSPLEVPEPVGEHPKTHEMLPIPLDEKAPFAALAFKVQMFSGRRHVYAKIYRGKLQAGQAIYNATRGELERVGRVLEIRADRREDLDKAVAGDIVLISGLRRVSTGDTICDPAHLVVLEPIRAYEPVMALAVETVKSSEDDKVLDSLQKMVEEDPTLRLVEDADTGQRLLRGMGELHLQVVLERMQREYAVEVRAGRPRVVYREGTGQTGVGEGVVDRTLEKGGRQHARVVVEVTPTSYELPVSVDQSAASVVVTPPEAILSETQRQWILDTIRQEAQTGPVQGYPLVGTEFRLVSVDLFGSESNEVALREAAARATRAALHNADAHLLTPIMHIEIEVPSDMVGTVMGDLQSRGGMIMGMNAEDSITQVQGECAMERLFGYVNDLRSSTQGRGTFTLRFSRLDRV